MARALARERWLALAAGGMASILLALLARPLLTGRIGVYGDLGRFHLPVRAFYARCLKAGEPFDWIPEEHNGVFITGEGEHGPYHPLHLLLYRTLPLHIAFAAEAYLSFPLMFLGMFVFMRRHAGRAGALLAGMVYTFSANTVSHAHHINYVAVAAHLPWLLWLLERVALTWGPARWRAAAGLALLTGSQVLLGHPQVFSFSLLAEGLYAMFLLRSACRPGRAAAAWCLGKVIGLAVGGVQLVATLAFLANSSRGSFDPFFGSFRPSRLLQLLLPNLMQLHLPEWTEEPAYFGAVAVVLLLWWLVARRTAAVPAAADASVGRLTRFAVVLGVLSVWLATGKYGGLYAVQTRLPVLGQLRAPVRYMNLAGLAAAILAGIAFGRLAAWVRAGRVLPHRGLVPAWLAAGVAIIAALLLQVNNPPTGAHGFDRRLLSGMAVMVAAAAALTLAVRGRAVGLYALVALAGYDLYHFCLANSHWGDPVWRDTRTLAEWRQAAPRPPVPDGGRMLFLAWDPLGLSLEGVRLVNGYRGGIEPRKRLTYEDVNALRLSCASWYREPSFGIELRIAGLEAAGNGWHRVPDPLPRVRLMSRAAVSDEPAAQLATTNLATTALTTHDLDLDGGPAGTAVMTEERPGQLGVETQAEAKRLLVVAESHDPGWGVTVDGTPAAVERINGDFLGCVVSPGRHRVEFTFRPPALLAGKALSLIGASACLLLTGLPFLRRRRA
jgi:hypothetical protein